MKMKLKLSLLACLLISMMSAFSQDTNFWVFLCFGQSNMESGGRMDDVDRTVDKRFQVMADFDSAKRGWQKGHWYDAVPPLAARGSGICMIDYFGRTMVSNLPPNIRIGVINVAVAGCKIEMFDKTNYQAYASTAASWLQNIVKIYDGNPYQYLVDRAKLAQKDGVIKGILLHQGESNSGDKEWPNKVKGIYDNLLQDLNLKAADVPLLAGELVAKDQGGACAGMNTIIDDLPKTIPTAHAISATGCTKANSLHFNPAGYRLLGTRYAETMLPLLGYKVAEPK